MCCIDGNPKHSVNCAVICTKGSAGIKPHHSPARLTRPLLRIGERGAGEFREMEWEEALALAAPWLGDIRQRNPDELALFTGRGQSQALTDWCAQQFGTFHHAAHGGLCSVNMATAAGVARTSAADDGQANDYALSAIAQQPMFMYHRWGSQNAWLRQITARNYLYRHPQTAEANRVSGGNWIWLVCPLARIRVQSKFHSTAAPGTEWTWNAIGKHEGAWRLGADAPENRDGFLLNHLNYELLPSNRDSQTCTNADPIPSQAAWFELRVRIDRDPCPQLKGHKIEMHAPRIVQ